MNGLYFLPFVGRNREGGGGWVRPDRSANRFSSPFPKTEFSALVILGTHLRKKKQGF